jgi:hypothetical protein
MITPCGRPPARLARHLPVHRAARRPVPGGPQAQHSSHWSQSPHRTQALVARARNHREPAEARDCRGAAEARNRQRLADTQRSVLSRDSFR